MTAIALYRLKPDVVAAQEQDGQVLVIGQDGKKRTMTPEAFALQYEPAETADVSLFLRRALPAGALPAGDSASEAAAPNGRRRKKKVKKKAAKRSKKAARAPATAPAPSGPKKPRYDWARARRMWDQGKKESAIAAALGCSDAAVYYRKKADNWPDRNGAARRGTRSTSSAGGRAPTRGRTAIPLTKHSSCGKLTVSNPCEHCHEKIAPAEIGNAA